MESRIDIRKLAVVFFVCLSPIVFASDLEIKQGLQLPVCLKISELGPKKSQLQVLSDSALTDWLEIHALSESAHTLLKKAGKKKISVNELPAKLKLKFKNQKKIHAQVLRKFSREVESLSSEYEKLLFKKFGKSTKPKINSKVNLEINSDELNELYSEFEKSEGYRLDCAQELLEIHVFLHFKFQQILEPEWQPELKFEPLKMPEFESPTKGTR